MLDVSFGFRKKLFDVSCGKMGDGGVTPINIKLTSQKNIIQQIPIIIINYSEHTKTRVILLPTIAFVHGLFSEVLVANVVGNKVSLLFLFIYLLRFPFVE